MSTSIFGRDDVYCSGADRRASSSRHPRNHPNRRKAFPIVPDTNGAAAPVDPKTYVIGPEDVICYSVCFTNRS